MLVSFSGLGRWGDYTGIYGPLIRVSGVFELQYDEIVMMELNGQVYTNVLGPCLTHYLGNYRWLDDEESDRTYFKIFKIDGEGGEYPEKVLFTRKDIIKGNTESDEDKVTDASEVTWRNLFIRDFNSKHFRYICAAVSDFIFRFSRLPKNHNELFEWLKKYYSQNNEGQPVLPDNKVIRRDNLRRNWSLWTRE